MIDIKKYYINGIFREGLYLQDKEITMKTEIKEDKDWLNFNDDDNDEVII